MLLRRLLIVFTLIIFTLFFTVFFGFVLLIALLILLALLSCTLVIFILFVTVSTCDDGLGGSRRRGLQNGYRGSLGDLDRPHRTLGPDGHRRRGLGGNLGAPFYLWPSTTLEHFPSLSKITAWGPY